jgi:hypothetical protein
VVEIDCDNIDAALPALRDAHLFDEVALYGSLIHAIGEHAAANMGAAQDLLRAKQIRITSIQVILPSLEDVFIARLRHADSAGQAGSSK